MSHLIKVWLEIGDPVISTDVKKLQKSNDKYIWFALN